jgi:O-glycosyl hydrolase
MKCKYSWLSNTIVSSFLFAVCCPAVTGAVSVTVDASKVVKSFEGWGTSICWWGNVVGNYSDKARDSIVTLLFDTSGLGLNILRYNIGGGEPVSHNHMGAGREIEGYKTTESSEYDWNRDAAQRKIVQSAKSKVDKKYFIAEAFSNSPPWWMTNSGCASGGKNGASNLKNNYYEAFADYLTDIVKHFNDEWGITFRTVEPFNEPISDWWKESGGQEGCHFSVNEQMTLIKEVSDKLKEKNLTTEIAASDETGYNEAIETYNAFNTLTRSLISQVNTHSYSGTKRKEIHDAVLRDKKRVWQSELDGSGASSPFDVWAHNHNDIVPGLDIAQRFIKDLKELQADAIIFWQAVESEQAQINLNKNWGCIHADFSGGEKFYLTKKFFSVKQFTKFVRPGSTLLDINNTDAVAFLSPSNNKLVIVQRNATDADISYEYKLSSFKSAAEEASIWRTSGSENFINIGAVDIIDGVIKATSKKQSVTTYIIEVQSGSVSAEYSIKHTTEDEGCSIGLSPQSDQLIIHNRYSGTSEIAFFDLSGKMLYSSFIGNGVHNISKPAGLIIIRISNKHGKYMTRVVTNNR